MKDPKIKTHVVHSLSKPSWNVIGTSLGAKHKIARIPYIVSDDKDVTKKLSAEAFQHAEYISYCFNNSAFICASN
jgi:hypothetical protein